MCILVVVLLFYIIFFWLFSFVWCSMTISLFLVCIFMRFVLVCIVSRECMHGMFTRTAVSLLVCLCVDLSTLMFLCVVPFSCLCFVVLYVVFSEFYLLSSLIFVIPASYFGLMLLPHLMYVFSESSFLYAQRIGDRVALIVQYPLLRPPLE